MKNGIVFSNAVAKYNELKLLKKEQIIRLTDASSYPEALKMLYDYGYSRAETDDLDGIIAAQIDSLNLYVREDCSDPHLEAVLLNPYYYNNAKVYYKSKFTPVGESALYALDDGIIKEGITANDYSRLPAAMSEALSRLDGLFSDGKPDGRIIDIHFNKAMFSESRSEAKASGDRTLKKYVSAQIDLTNMATVLRCRKLKSGWEYCAEMLFGGGDIPFSRLSGAFSAPEKDFAAHFEKTRYEGLLEKVMKGLSNLDTAIEGALIETGMAEIMEMTSLSPFLSYYLRQLLEYKIVKMILTCIKNGAKHEIDKRLRGIYD